MTAWAMAYVRRHSHALAKSRDFLDLTKPRIAVMVLLTVATGVWLAGWGNASPLALWHALIGTALVAASGCTANAWLEQKSDARMRRTANRPLPAGRIASGEALVMCVATIVAGVGYLAWTLGTQTALLGLASWTIYALIYTPLKVCTIYNTAVGAVAGAMPVLIGWSAGGGRIDLMAGTLFLIIYLWQFPHFMAIAWIYRDDYAAGGLQMLPCVDPTGARTGVQAVSAALMLLPITLIPALVYGYSLAYVLAALLLGGVYLAGSIVFLVRRDDASARLLLRVSLVYLPLLLGTLVYMPLV
jgi:protoheme IX farnesyltransferase